MKNLKYCILSILAYGYSASLSSMEPQTFSVTLQATASARYLTLINFQELLKKQNLGNTIFYQPDDLHMTLLYLQVPASKEPNGKLLAQKLATIVSEFQEAIAQTSFSPLQGARFIQGASKQFVGVQYEPDMPFKIMKNNLLDPLIARIKNEFPGTTVEPYNFNYSDFHISLGYLKPGYSTKNFKIPDQLPAIANYTLAKSTLQVSVRNSFASWLANVPNAKVHASLPPEKFDSKIALLDLKKNSIFSLNN